MSETLIKKSPTQGTTVLGQAKKITVPLAIAAFALVGGLATAQAEPASVNADIDLCYGPSGCVQKKAQAQFDLAYSPGGAGGVTGPHYSIN